MKTIITALRNHRENIEAGVAALFLVAGILMATGLAAVAFASAQSVRPDQITVYSHASSVAGGLERSYRRGGTIKGYQVVL
jgi:hypothetical protein